ncbi:MAG: hypothetical protein Q8K67_11170 [Geothrix sp.]|nr:hypothetical protein [Geothrix sp.]
MSIGDVLIVLTILVFAALITRFIRGRWGRFVGVGIFINAGESGPRRTPGEIHRELWEQKGTLDKAVADCARARVTNHASWHAPDAPCEVEPGGGR